MRKIIFKIFLLGIISSLLSCEKELMNYEGNEGVYFSVRRGHEVLKDRHPYYPSTDIDFVISKESEIDLKLEVAITGPVKDYDRVFRVEVNRDSTTATEGVHYVLPKNEWVILANSNKTVIDIKIKNAQDLQIAQKHLMLNLVPTSDFVLAFPKWKSITALNAGTVPKEFDASQHKINFSDIMKRPIGWYGDNANGKEINLLGEFSRKKMEFITESTKINYDVLNLPMSSRLLYYIHGICADKLVERYNAGVPVLEEDGRLMWLEGVPWESYIGVPYKP